MDLLLSLGSNIGDRKQNLLDAIGLIGKSGIIEPVHCSSIYETRAVDYLDQPDFLNLVLCCETDALPETCLKTALNIEATMGRKRSIAKGPRIIDIDLLTMAESRINSADLTIPHPAMLARAFVLVPLEELFPQRKWNGKTASQWLEQIGREGVTIAYPTLDPATLII